MIKWVILGLIFIIFAYTLTWCLIMGSSNDESRRIDDEEQMKWLREYQKKKGWAMGSPLHHGIR